MVEFSQPGSLGLQLEATSKGSVPRIKLVRPNTQASTKSALRPGLYLRSVDQRFVRTHGAAIVALKGSSRPVVLGFHRQPDFEVEFNEGELSA